MLYLYLLFESMTKIGKCVTFMTLLAIPGVHTLVPGALHLPTTPLTSYSSPKSSLLYLSPTNIVQRPYLPLTSSLLYASPTSSADNVEARRVRHDWRQKKKKEVIKFAGPALSTVLADPIMSVVDALCVGRFCSTVELASLGPALAVFNFVSYFFFFLNAATCVQVTSALAVKDKNQATNVLSDAIFLAAGSGIVLAGLVLYYSTSLIAFTGCVPELKSIASRYLSIRALGLPIVLVTMVIQSALMGQFDTITPLQTILTASLLNIMGDIYLIPSFGAAGAAWATLWSQIAAFPLLLSLCKLRKRLPIVLRPPHFASFKSFFNTAGPCSGMRPV